MKISLAVISDIHGNLPALEAVVADLRSLAPDAVYVLGDIVNGCPWSAETFDLLAAQGWPMLMGNHDDAVLQLGTPRMEPRYADRARYAALWWTRSHLPRRILAALEVLPLEFRLAFEGVPPLRLVHGLPGNFFVGLRPDSPEEWAARKLAPVSEATVAAGHTHAAMIRRIGRPDSPGDGWLVVNSGSVGAPYDGDVRAGYALLRGDRQGWRAEIRRVAYDLDAVEAGFRQSGLLAEGGALGEMFRRSVLSGLPWVSDFAWWLRGLPAGELADMAEALRRYDATHGPGRWSFPYAG